jgi:hypothetical protein
VPVTGFYTCRGNLNAAQEIIRRGKKFPIFAPKMMQIGTFVGQFRTDLVFIAESF